MKKVQTLSTVDLLLADIKFPMNSPQPFTVAKMLSKMQYICLKLANNLRWADSILKLRHFITHYFQPFSACWLIIYFAKNKNKLQMILVIVKYRLQNTQVRI